MLAQSTPGARVFAFCLLPFVILATLNSGGYRYGASDQAFYIPAILEQLDPSLFPRDGAVLGAQTKLTIIDEMIAWLAQGTGISLPPLFIGLYVTALLIFAGGVWLIGRRLYLSAWTSVALLGAMSLRHAIARSGTNTLEGYFHPRMLAYALGALAIAFFLRRSLGAVAILLLVALAVHPTTAVWFGVWLTVAAAIAAPAHRRPLLAVIIVGIAAAIWGVVAGPLAGRLVLMDDEWRGLLASKDYLFPLQWPAYAWLINLGYLPVLVLIHRRRVAAGLVDAYERALVYGSSILLVIFVGALVCHAIGIALAFQLQPARVFWMFDFLAVLHVVWWLAEGTGKAARPALLATTIAVLSLARGIYVVTALERTPLELTIPDHDWGRVMRWARTTDKGAGWFADPLHAVLYGSSVRVAGERDVLVEAVKDAAIGMYDREIAVRTDQRVRDIGDFKALTAETATRIGARYDMDYLVTESRLDLPLAFESGALRVYRLR